MENIAGVDSGVMLGVEFSHVLSFRVWSIILPVSLLRQGVGEVVA